MYKKIGIITSTYLPMPLMISLHQQGLLEQVMLHPDAESMLREPLSHMIAPMEINRIADPTNPPVNDSCDLVIVMGYPVKITGTYTAKLVNIHFGPLPENKGPDPVFWTLQSGKLLAYVAIHEINAADDLDSGLILKEQSFDIAPGENYGLLSSRLSHMSIQLVQELIAGDTKPRAQEADRAQYHPMPSGQDFMIDWNEMTSLQIENLVNACNPVHGGAKTVLQGGTLSIYEVMPASLVVADADAKQPGEVVHSSLEQGLVVKCKDSNYLKITILSLNEGIFSGNKIAALGTPVGTILGQ
ncbi:MAG: formyltransferase family protein [Cytophagales bacterium]|nr:formyltransferase family protein [Cytophagales bacterium]